MDIATHWTSRDDSDARAEVPEFVAILERALAGDPAAFEQILLRHERRVLMLSWRLLGNIADAQDAAQEVFLRAFKYLHRFDSRKPLEGWLVRITVNVCRDLGRSRQRQNSVVEIHGEDLDMAEPSDPHSVFVSQEQKQLLREAVASLPVRERAAFVLRDLDGLDTSEVADILQCTESTVRSQVSAARVRIRKLIQQRLAGGER